MATGIYLEPGKSIFAQGSKTLYKIIKSAGFIIQENVTVIVINNGLIGDKYIFQILVGVASL